VAGPSTSCLLQAGAQGKSGTPVKFWRTIIELPRIRARADPQKKNGQRELVLPLTIPWSDEYLCRDFKRGENLERR